MNKQYSTYHVAAFVSFLAFAAYIPAFQNEFVWDDVDYIVENANITALNAAFFQWAFFDFFLNNWHPVTWLSHALDYAVWGLNPLGHHLTSILLHSGNTFLVVFLCVKLLETGRNRAHPDEALALDPEQRTLIAAGAAGLLFGLHPVHVESVAWITDRKDLLCALFFLLSVLAYTGYVESPPVHSLPCNKRERERHKLYLLALIFFIFALMSKPMAVTVPLVLLMLDWYPFRRVRSWRTFGHVFVEKLPFFGLSIALSYVAILSQRSGGTLELTELVPLQVRLLVAAKSLVTNLVNMIAPVGLSPYYPYPGPQEIARHVQYYFFSVGFLVVTTAIIFIAARKRKAWLALWGYFVITFIPVIGIIQVGGQATADRYTYLPSIGPFFALGLIAARPWSRRTAFGPREVAAKRLAAFAALSIVVVLSYATMKQTSLWKNNIALWNYVIAKEPERLPFAYNNRGLAFIKSGQPARAIEDYSAAIAIDPTFSVAYCNRGLAYEAAGEYERALADYSAALKLQPSDAIAYNSRGRLFAEMEQSDRALADYNQAIGLNPFFKEAYNNRGQVLDDLGWFDEAIKDFSTAIMLDSGFAAAYLNRGRTFGETGQIDEAIEDYTMALSLKPDFVSAFLHRGALYLKTSNPGLALNDFQKACDQGSEEGCRALSSFDKR